MAENLGTYQKTKTKGPLTKRVTYICSIRNLETVCYRDKATRNKLGSAHKKLICKYPGQNPARNKQKTYKGPM